MAMDMLNELFEVVVAACDTLYNERKLITHKAVLQIIESQGRWSREYLEKTLPEHINQWRLQNLGMQNPVECMQKQMDLYESERIKIIRELREMLGKMGRDSG